MTIEQLTVVNSCGAFSVYAVTKISNYSTVSFFMPSRDNVIF